MLLIKKSYFYTMILVFLTTHSVHAGQPFELKRHFYYKIKKEEKLIGYAEEYLKPVRELPNLEVEVSFTTKIGTQYARSRLLKLEKKELYYIDLTHDKLLKGEIHYSEPTKNKTFKVNLDFQHFKFEKQEAKSARKSKPVLMSRNTVLLYHRFLALFLEKRVTEKQLTGSLPLIWTSAGEISEGHWQALNDTTLTVNGVHLRCNHFVVNDHIKRPVYEFWTLENSGRLVKYNEFATGICFELADVTFKNYVETPFQLDTKKPMLSRLAAKVIDNPDRAASTIRSEFIEYNMDDVEYPFDADLLKPLESYLEPIDSPSPFDADTLFQIGMEFTKTKSYFDEVLATFSRWSTHQNDLKTVLEKEMNRWDQTDYQRFTQTLALFSRLCRNCNIPTRFVRGIYCLSVVENLCYNWIWLEVSDGKNWYPWHLETPHTPYGGAEFIRVLPVDWEYVKNFKFTPVKNMVIEDYQFYIKRSLF